MTQQRNHKVKSHYGLSDYYNYYKRNSLMPVSRSKYNHILKDLLNEFTDMVIGEGYSWRLPAGLGRVFLAKIKPKTKIDSDGNIETNKPIDWHATNKLWEKYPEAKESKQLVYYDNFHTKGYVFFIKYSKKGLQLKNGSMYKIQFNRQKKRKLAKNVKTGQLDALILK